MKDFNSFDYFIQNTRMALISKYVPEGAYLLDIGCDCNPRNLLSLQNKIRIGVGIDKVPVNTTNNKKLSFVEHDIEKSLPFDNNEFDTITMLAVLEHLKHPQEVLIECFRVLKPGGRLILTIPSYYSRPLLEALAFMKIISKDAISTHLHYFKKHDIETLLENACFKKKISKYYNLFLNILCVYEKYE